MPDREKVLRGLECCIKSTWDDPFSECEHCPYNEISIAVQECRAVLSTDALALLKEQEEETKFVYDEHTLPMCEKCTFHPFAGYIPTIKWMKERGYMKCPRCGRSVKWE